MIFLINFSNEEINKPEEDLKWTFNVWVFFMYTYGISWLSISSMFLREFNQLTVNILQFATFGQVILSKIMSEWILIQSHLGCSTPRP